MGIHCPKRIAWCDFWATLCTCVCRPFTLCNDLRSLLLLSPVASRLLLCPPFCRRCLDVAIVVAVVSRPQNEPVIGGQQRESECSLRPLGRREREKEARRRKGKSRCRAEDLYISFTTIPFGSTCFCQRRRQNRWMDVSLFTQVPSSLPFFPSSFEGHLLLAPLYPPY